VPLPRAILIPPDLLVVADLLLVPDMGMVVLMNGQYFGLSGRLKRRGQMTVFGSVNAECGRGMRVKGSKLKVGDRGQVIPLIQHGEFPPDFSSYFCNSYRIEI
jgi:hypothetical protein